MKNVNEMTEDEVKLALMDEVGNGVIAADIPHNRLERLFCGGDLEHIGVGILKRQRVLLHGEHCCLHLLFNSDCDSYSIEQRKVTVPSFEIPEPVREPLEEGQIYWFAKEAGIILMILWENDSTDHKRLEAGRVHLTKEDAQAHFDAEQAAYRAALK